MPDNVGSAARIRILPTFGRTGDQITVAVRCRRTGRQRTFRPDRGALNDENFLALSDLEKIPIDQMISAGRKAPAPRLAGLAAVAWALRPIGEEAGTVLGGATGAITVSFIQTAVVAAGLSGHHVRLASGAIIILALPGHRSGQVRYRRGRFGSVSHKTIYNDLLGSADDLRQGGCARWARA